MTSRRVKHPHLSVLTVLTAVLAASSPNVTIAGENDPAPDAEASRTVSGWPMFIGPGNRSPERRGIALVDDLKAARKVWELRHHAGVGKGLYPGTLRRARSLGIEPFYGGAASPIVADGTVFLSYYKPDGKVPAAIEPWRTMRDPKSLLPEWFFSVTADDILIAVDARTGTLRWSASEEGGFNRLGHKRAHWCVSPAYADRRVFSMGTTGVLRAYDARTGEKLWETPASPELEKLHEEYLETRKLCWKGSEGSSLIVADGVVVAARKSLVGVDAKTGRKLWRIAGDIESQYGTPTLWRHGGREYVLANSGRGDLRLIDPRDGRVVWHVEGLGPNLGTLSTIGDIVILNVGSTHTRPKKTPGLLGAYRLSLENAKRLWTLPDRQPYWHGWWKDKGPSKNIAVRDGRAFIGLHHPKDENNRRPPSSLLVVDVETGTILSEQDAGKGSEPYLMEDRLLLFHDRHHSHPVTMSFWTADVEPRRLSQEMSLNHVDISAYEVPIQWPFVDGYLYCRTLEGLACYDLRKEAKGHEKTARAVLEAFSKEWDESAWTGPNRKGRSADFMRPLNDLGWRVRMRALQKLVRIGKESIPALVKTLEAGNGPSRILAAQALGYLAPHAPREALKKAIQSDEADAVRLYAVDSLGMQGGDASEFLRSRLDKETNRDVRLHMKYALEREGRPVEPSVIKALHDWDSATLHSPEVGKAAPDFELSTVSGARIRLSDFRGDKHVVLVFVYGDT